MIVTRLDGAREVTVLRGASGANGASVDAWFADTGSIDCGLLLLILTQCLALPAACAWCCCCHCWHWWCLLGSSAPHFGSLPLLFGQLELLFSWLLSHGIRPPPAHTHAPTPHIHVCAHSQPQPMYTPTATDGPTNTPSALCVCCKQSPPPSSAVFHSSPASPAATSRQMMTERLMVKPLSSKAARKT